MPCASIMKGWAQADLFEAALVAFEFSDLVGRFETELAGRFEAAALTGCARPGAGAAVADWLATTSLPSRATASCAG